MIINVGMLSKGKDARTNQVQKSAPLGWIASRPVNPLESWNDPPKMCLGFLHTWNIDSLCSSLSSHI